MSTHYTRDYVWVVHNSLASFNIPYAALAALGIHGIYLHSMDSLATDAKRREVVTNGFKCGLIYASGTTGVNGTALADAASKKLGQFAATEAKDPAGSLGGPGQTPIIFDFEPVDGSYQLWVDFIPEWRTLRPGRVSDFTPEGFKEGVQPLTLIRDARFDAKPQCYFGDMSQAETSEVLEPYQRLFGFDAVRPFVGGGRGAPYPALYKGQAVRRLRPGTAVWNANLLRESGLI